MIYLVIVNKDKFDDEQFGIFGYVNDLVNELYDLCLKYDFNCFIDIYRENKVENMTSIDFDCCINN